MGLTPSKEQLMIRIIDTQDVEELSILTNDLKREEVQRLYKALVPEDKNQCTILHYATWHGIREKYF